MISFLIHFTLLAQRDKYRKSFQPFAPLLFFSLEVFNPLQDERPGSLFPSCPGFVLLPFFFESNILSLWNIDIE